MDKSRDGMFTSSNMHRLICFGKDGKSLGAPAKNYIKEKKYENKLGGSINLEVTSHELSWGRTLEGFVYDNHIESSYVLDSNSTIIADNKLFCGTPDLISGDCVADIKCPHTRKSFCELIEIIETGTTEFFKENNDKYYWQIVANSILTKSTYGELIVFMPYESEIPDIIQYIDMLDDFQAQLDIQWVIHSSISRIPHLPNDSGYKNINRFKFKIPQEDKDLLLERVTLANTYLNL